MAYEATLSLPGICFTHYRTGEQAEDEAALMAAILADAMNAGAERMAQSSRDVTIHRMMVMWSVIYALQSMHLPPRPGTDTPSGH